MIDLAMASINDNMNNNDDHGSLTDALFYAFRISPVKVSRRPET